MDGRNRRKGTHMETSKGILLFSLSAVLLGLALAGCTKRAQERPQDEALVIEPLVGIGPVRFGASRDEVVRYFGPPARASETGLNYIAAKGLAFTVDPQHGLRQIKCWSDRLPAQFAVTTFSGRTKEGIGMGASRERIVAAYGQPERTDSSGDFENLCYDKLGAKFTLSQGTVSAIILDVPK